MRQFCGEGGVACVDGGVVTAGWTGTFTCNRGETVMRRSTREHERKQQDAYLPASRRDSSAFSTPRGEPERNINKKIILYLFNSFIIISAFKLLEHLLS